MSSKITYFLLLFFVSISFCSSQNDNILAKKGTIHLINDAFVIFNNIKLIGGSFSYFDTTSGLEVQNKMNEVLYVYDDKNSLLFSNKTLIEKLKQKGTITAEEEKKLFIEKTLKEEEEKEKLEFPKRLKLVPDGIYATKEDFLKQSPSSVENVAPKELIGFDRPFLNTIEDNCFFYYASSNIKITNTFAISYKGHLYFQIYAILENRNKTDRAQSNNFPNSFVRVQSAGTHYYYLEADLVNQWVQGLAYSGGAAGGMLANTLFHLKGIVWDIKNNEFNIFKNCVDYNDFIKNLYPEGVQECKNQQADIIKIREAIEIIK